MLLLFFAFLCALIWYYTTYSFQDETSKSALIPGFKVAMLMAIFIFVMVDVFMFIETNRLVQASMNSINGSCVTYDGSQSYYPSLQSVYGATLLSGTTASLAYVHDGNIDDIMEGNVGTTYLFVNYTGVATFDKLDFAGQVTGNTTPFTIDLYDNTTGWVSIYSFSYPGDFQIPITINGSRFIDNGTVEARVASATTGQVTDHLQVDWLILEGSQTYNMYCADSYDTQLVFIYHEMETQMMLVIMNMLPFLAMMIATIIAIQFALLLGKFWVKDKGEKK